MKNKYNLKEYFTIILGAIIILAYFWSRFIKENMSNITRYFIVFSIFFSVILFIKTLYVLTNKNKTVLKNQLITHIIVSYLDIITKAPIKVYELIYQWKYFPIKFIIEKPISYITAYLYYPTSLYPQLISIFLLQIPKAIVSTLFLIEILYFHQLYYFMKILWLLLTLLLSIRIFLYLSYHHSKKNIEYFDLYIEFFKIENNAQVFVRYCNSLPNIENPIDITIVQLNIIAGWYTIYANIRNFIKTIYDFNDIISPYFTLYASFCFVIGWSYFLYLSCLI